MGRMRMKGRGWLAAAACLLMASCAPSVSQYRQYYDALNPPSGTVSKTGPVEAIERARGNYPARDRVLYGMDLGMANNVVGNYRESAKIFRDTDRIIQELYTKSVTNILRGPAVPAIGFEPDRIGPWGEVELGIVECRG